MAKRSAQLWLGTTLPSGDIAIRMEDPTGEPEAWEREWRACTAKTIAGHAA